jgi:hypothetical protein
MAREALPNSLDTRMTRMVDASPAGSVFTPRDFAQMGSREAIAKCLERLVRREKLRRLSQGLYDKPRHDDLFGVLWPTPEAVIKAITEKTKIRVQPAGVYAANQLGLSEQVPAKIVLLTDGSSRTVKAGPMRISLKRTSPRNMAAFDRLAGMVIQAFRSLGAKHIDEFHIARLKKTIPAKERAKLLEDIDLAPAWMRPFFFDLAGANERTAKKSGSKRKKP